MLDLELDELWTFVLTKANDTWIWLALVRVTRQVVAVAVGPRTEATARRLWDAIPNHYRGGRCYTDFLQQYMAVVPFGQHRPVGKESGFTAHIERFNNTLRQRLARLVRKTLSFSKSLLMLEASLLLFLWRYNLDQVRLWPERRKQFVKGFRPLRRRSRRV
jgi:insertion element IS1 protein InsB